MLQHDHDIGLVLDFLKQNGFKDNTIVWYSTDNGPHSSWPHGATTPFRGEKMSTYGGGVRVISMLRWPGVIKPGQILNGIQSHMDMFTSLAAVAGVPDVAEKEMKEKHQYIDGLNNLPYWKGESDHSARNSIFYYYELRDQTLRGTDGSVEVPLLHQGRLLRQPGAPRGPTGLQPADGSLRKLQRQGILWAPDAKGILADGAHG